MRKLQEIVTPIGTVVKDVYVVVYTKYISKYNCRRWKVCIIKNDKKTYFTVEDDEYINYVVSLGAKCMPMETV